MLPEYRFVGVPRTAVDKRISTESGDLKKEIENLEKRMHYLEMTYKNSQENLEAIMKSGRA